MVRRRDTKKLAGLRNITLAMASLLLMALIILASSLQLSAKSSGGGYRKLRQTSAGRNLDLACKATQYPDVCKSSLSKSGLKPNASPAEIIAAAFSVSSDGTTNSYEEAKKLLSLSSNANYTAAVSNCVEYLEGAIRYLHRSKGQELRGLKLKDVKAWTSAALTYQLDCGSALKYVNTSQAVGDAMQRLVTLGNETSNALSMLWALDAYGENMAAWRPPQTERQTSGSPSSGGHFEEFQKRILASLKKVGMVPNVVVTKGESIQKAVDAAPDNSVQKYVIYIKEGVYEEIVRVPPPKTNLVFVGDGMDKTVITGSLSVPSLPGPVTTYGSATVAVNADGFMARDITFQNAAGPDSHQAVALRVDGDFSAFHNCAILGHQDSLYTHTLRQFYKNCRIEGTIDFIFGNSAAIFDNCVILIRPRQLQPEKGASNPITAQGRIDPAMCTGLVFHNCTINGTEEYVKYFNQNPKVHKAYLGRPWKMFSRAIFKNSYIGEIIDLKGWMPWSGNFALKTLYYGEYQNYGPGASLSGRVSWSSQVPEHNVGMYSVESFVQGDEWQAAITS